MLSIKYVIQLHKICTALKKNIPNVSMEGGSYQVKSIKHKLFFELKLVNMRWTQVGTEAV